MSETIKLNEENNPVKWAECFSEYVINEHKNLRYGQFVLLKKEAPRQAVDAYKKYITLLSHMLPSWEDVIIEDWEIKGFRKSDDAEMQEQYNIVMQLIDEGLIAKTIKH